MSSHEAHKAKPAAKRLAAKIALITGGSRGIGAAIALRLAADCARVVISYKRNRAAADEVVAKIAEHGGTGMELYLAVVRYAIDAEAKMALDNQALGQNADPSDALRQIIHGVLERLSGTQDQFGLQLRFMLKEIANPTPALAQMLKEAFLPLYNRLRALVGQILNLPVDHNKTLLCTHSIMGQVAHYSHTQPVMSQLWPGMKMSPEQREMIANHIADFSLAYLRAQRAESSTSALPTSRRKHR